VIDKFATLDDRFQPLSGRWRTQKSEALALHP
jgi:hypothetical protein